MTTRFKIAPLILTLLMSLTAACAESGDPATAPPADTVITAAASTPAPSPTPIVTTAVDLATPTRRPDPTAPTAVATMTPIPTPAADASPTPGIIPTNRPTVAPAATETGVPAATATAAPLPTNTPTPTASPTPRPTSTPVPALLPPSAGVTTPPPNMFNAYYEKVLNADGIPILSTSAVADSALVEAGRLLNGMIGDRNDVRAALIENDARVGIIGENENTTDIPEHRYLKLDSATDWDARSRGFGGTSWAPITTAGEENLLCLPGDRYTGENIFIHEFAHTLMNLALPFIPGGDDIIQQVKDAYADAVMSGLWQNTYAGSNYEEYWAEGTQAYFGAQKFAASADGVHNEITTRAKLVDYDPVLADLVAEVMDESWSYDLSCGGPT